jgi:hypothetical protein
MPEFLAETYLSRDAAAPGAASLARAAGGVSGQQAPVRFLGAIHVPEEETCFCLYQAPTAAGVHAAMTAAGLRPERITRAVPIRPPTSHLTPQAPGRPHPGSRTARPMPP